MSTIFPFNRRHLQLLHLAKYFEIFHLFVDTNYVKYLEKQLLELFWFFYLKSFEKLEVPKSESH